ncbi:MAG TPA: hypothetical protein DCG32_02335 [Sphaerochaeta sp.]|jgi:uncharacterized membrane protein YdjX (TVP38/TMEM64 family)|nr:hypothetical protein [Sphaerochaeta sp.]
MTRKILNIFSILGLLGCLAYGIFLWKAGVLTSLDSLHRYVAGYGSWSALFFLAFQAVQVILPVLPGSLGCLVGVLAFGVLKGFIFNYVGIVIGSLGAFALSRLYGRPLLFRIFSSSMIEKYDRWMEKKGRFVHWLAILIFLPVAPDDYLCFLAGTTTISWRNFATIIVLGKPFSIALYSLGLTTLFTHLIPWS